VTGVKLTIIPGMPIILLTHLIEVESTSSRTHVTPAPGSVLRAQRQLLSLGQDIEAQLHSHPGRTANATKASIEDLATALSWSNGAPFLGGIFSEGGRFVRFFNPHQSFEVKIYENALRTVETNCFELPARVDDKVSAPASESTGLVLDGSAAKVTLVEPENPSRLSRLARWLWRPWRK
jgi:hypothetical protein